MPTSYNVSTYGDATRDYTSLDAWEAATDNDLVTAAKGEVLECYADSSEFTDNVVVADATTNSSYFRVIKPASGEGHDGTPNNGVKFTYPYSEIQFTVQEDYAGVYDIVGKNTYGTGYAIAFYTDNSTAKFVGCIAHDMTHNADNNWPFYISAGKVINCLAIEASGGSGGNDAGFLADGTAYYYNCTSADCYVGFWQSSGSPVAKNCASEDSTSGYEWVGTWSKTTCTDNDGVVFKNTSNNDYHLASSDTYAKDQGTDLSSDGTFAFDDDIDGDTRSGTWDIGFDEWVSAGNAVFFGMNF